MAKNLNLIVVISCLAFALLWSCQRDNSPSVTPPVTPPDPPPVQEKVAANIHGRVIDDTKQPVEGVAVTAGGLTATTDINGYFTITNTSLVKSAGFVQAAKTGYFTASRTFLVHPNVENNVMLQLIPKKSAGNFVAANGGTVTFPSGGNVTFPANAIVNPASNAVYSGSVTVSAFFLDPASPYFESMMPGDLRGMDTSKKEVGLKSYGMTVIELNGAGGEKLQLANGKQAAVTFPITLAMQNDAPSTIPLWFFNDSTGLWKQEGVATKQGTNYVGSVGHFSFWNCDAPISFVNFEATFKDQNGNPLKSTLVTLTRNGNGLAATTPAITDDNGFVSGKVPANESLFMNVFSVCGVSIYAKQIGPFSSDTKLDAITVNVTPQQTVTISGRVTNCNSESVNSGVVTISIDDQYQKATVTNGAYSISILRCSADVVDASIVAYDIATNKLSSTKKISVTTGAVDAGTIKACDIDADRYVIFSLIDNGDTTKYSFISPGDSISVGRQYILAAVMDYSSRISLGFSEAPKGIGPVTYTGINVSNKRYYLGSNGSPMTGNITAYGPNNTDYVSGDFSATLRDSLQKKDVKVEGLFRVLNRFN